MNYNKPQEWISVWLYESESTPVTLNLYLFCMKIQFESMLIFHHLSWLHIEVQYGCVCFVKDPGELLWLGVGEVVGSAGVLHPSECSGDCLWADHLLDRHVLLPPNACHQHHQVLPCLLHQEGQKHCERVTGHAFIQTDLNKYRCEDCFWFC